MKHHTMHRPALAGISLRNIDVYALLGLCLPALTSVVFYGAILLFGFGG